MDGLFTRYPLTLQSSYADLKQRALEQTSLLVGTPGTVSERVKDGRTYFYRQFYDAEGAKGAEHIGPTDDEAAITAAEEMRERVANARSLLEDAQMLGRVGYIRCDASADAVLVACANAGLFRAGAILVGSHAFGALLNDLGARTGPLVTEDIDIARRERLPLGADVTLSFEAVLQTSRIPFQGVPSLERKGHSTSYRRVPGKNAVRTRVDLLAPAPGNEVVTVAVPELEAHATGLPYLRYLLGEPTDTIVIGRSSIVPVKVPRPERIAWHKLAVSEMRHETSNKKQKDVKQASVLFAALTLDSPASLEDGRRALPSSLVPKIRRAAPMAEALLVEGGHANAVELLRELL